MYSCSTRNEHCGLCFPVRLLHVRSAPIFSGTSVPPLDFFPTLKIPFSHWFDVWYGFGPSVWYVLSFIPYFMVLIIYFLILSFGLRWVVEGKQSWISNPSSTLANVIGKIDIPVSYRTIDKLVEDMSQCVIHWTTFSKTHLGWIAISVLDIILLPASRHSRVGCEPTRSRVSVWVWRSGTIQWHKRHWHDLPCPSIGHGGLQMAFQQHRTNCLVCTQLLLQVRECC